MFHHFLFVERLSRSLNEKLSGSQIIECFSQQKEELIIVFLLPQNSRFYLKASFDPSINLLSFPNSFHRTRKNSIDLFAEVIGQSVINIIANSFDRSFVVQLNDHSLLFQLYNRRSNVVLYQNENPIKFFRSSLARSLNIHSFKRNFDFRSNDPQDLASLEKISGPKIINYLTSQEGYDQSKTDEKFKLIENLIAEIGKNKINIIGEQRPEISLLPEQNFIFQSSDPISICNELFLRYTKTYLLEIEKEGMINKLRKQIKKNENYITNSLRKLKLIKNRRSNEEIANIIMANLHSISTEAKSVELDDIYGTGKINIKLNPGLSPQKNAERFYRKSKKEKREVSIIQRNVNSKQELITKLRNEIDETRRISAYKELREKIKSEPSRKRKDVPLPYRKITFEGFDIYIGKDAKSNDLMTLKHAHKDDLWLHARDVSGSHLLLKNGDNRKIPDTVLEFAAAVAAFYSKRKADTLCPVIYTQRKYVRKPKGFPPGKVLVEKEKVIMVKPHDPRTSI